MLRSLVALSICALLLTAAAAAPADPASETRLRLKVHADAAGRDLLSSEGYDIAGHALLEGWVEVITDPDGASRLQELGFFAEVLELREGPRPLGAGAGVQPTAFAAASRTLRMRGSEVLARRNSSGSIPAAAAMMSICDSRAKTLVLAPGARQAPVATGWASPLEWLSTARLGTS